jgi:hypothetical protein
MWGGFFNKRIGLAKEISYIEGKKRKKNYLNNKNNENRPRRI